MLATPELLKLTYEDYLSFPEDGRRHEIIDGEHCMTAAPSPRHQTISRNLLWCLETFLRGRGLGTVLAAPLDVVLSTNDVVQPDLVYVAERRREMLTDVNVQGAPDLVVEILSPSTRRADLTLKRKRYERLAVEEYWVVDPELETVQVFRRRQDAFDRMAELSLEADARLSSPLLPGLEIPLSEIFAR